MGSALLNPIATSAEDREKMGRLKAPPGPEAVHLCLDMQLLFGPQGPWSTPWMERVLPRQDCRARAGANNLHPLHPAFDASRGTWHVARLLSKMVDGDAFPPRSRCSI